MFQFVANDIAKYEVSGLPHIKTKGHNQSPRLI